MTQSKSPIVKCPGCNVPMGVRLVATGGPGEFSKVTYACVICRAETVRQYKMPAPPPGAPGEDREAI